MARFAFFLALLPFVQLGYTYYLSVAGLGCIAILYSTQNARLLVQRDILFRLAAVILMITATAVYDQVNTEDLLRTAREGAFFFLITGCSRWEFDRQGFNASHALTLVALLLLAALALVFIQNVFFGSGVRFGIPAEFYSQNAGTLPGYLDLIYVKQRPAATFGEPSYLGGVCLGLLFAVSPALKSSIKAKFVALIAVATIAVSSSLSALIMVLIFLSYCFLRQTHHPVKYLIFPFALVLAVSALVLMDASTWTRLSKLGTSQELSGLARIIVPLSIIPGILSESPLGIPFLQLAQTSIPELGWIGIEVLHNALLNTILTYGLFGFFVIWVLLWCTGDPYLRLFVFLIALQNGGLFTPDKFFIVAFCTMTFNSLRLRAPLRVKHGLASQEHGRPKDRITSLPNMGRSIKTLGCVVLISTFTLLLNHSAFAWSRELIVRSGSDEVLAPTLSDAISTARRFRAAGKTGATVIKLPPGTLTLTEPLRLTAEDSDLIIEGSSEQPTFLSGSKPAEAVPIDTKVRRTDKNIIAVRATPPVSARKWDVSSDSNFDIYQGRRTLRLSRWPATGFTSRIEMLSSESGTVDKLRIPEIPADAAFEPSPWIGMYWDNDWSFETIRAHRGADRRTFEISPIKAPGLRRSPRLFVENLFSTLREPGTYVVDEADKYALVLPLGDGKDLEVSNISTLLTIEDAHDIAVRNLGIEKTLSDAVRIVNSRDISLQDCYVGQAGATGILVIGGANVRINGCVVSDTAEGGVRLVGGDRTSLTRSNHSIENSVITKFGRLGRDYKAGIRIEGVGITIDRCLIFDGVASGIVLSGNDHTVQRNEISEVLADSDDAGAIYMGRDWTQRGIQIRNNYIHDVGYSRGKSFLVGIYLDDLFSGASIEGNILDRINRPIVLGGGRDNAIGRNLVIEPERAAITTDDRGLLPGWDQIRDEVLGKFKQTAKTSAWAKYSELATILDNNPFSPEGNRIYRNIVLNGTLLSQRGYLPPTTMQSNFHIDLPSFTLAQVRHCLLQLANCSSGVQGLDDFRIEPQPNPRFSYLINR